MTAGEPSVDRARRTEVRPRQLVGVALLSATATSCGGGGAATSPEGGDAAQWVVAGNGQLGADTTEFTASVSRVGCNNGVTGTVIEPTVVYEDSRVVITFTVAARDGDANCPSNRPEKYDVTLSESIGDRMLVDGQCLDGETAARAPRCTRWSG